jgi:hypothetical protein
MLIRGYSLLLLILSLPAICAQAQVTQEPQRLESGKPIERDIAGGESHTYRLELAAGQFLRVLVEQKGVDVALTLAGPDGTQIIESDLTDTLGTREPLSYETRRRAITVWWCARTVWPPCAERIRFGSI